MSELERAKKIIYEHDLSRTIRRIMFVDGWSKKHAEMACEQYRNYLFLKKKYGKDYVLPPSYEIDEFWHAHILHTKSYIDFCNQVFGFYMHHHPHHGMDMEITDQAVKQAFEEQTQKLYLKEFGEYLYAFKPKNFLMKILSFIEEIPKFLTFFRSKKLVYKS